MPKHSNVYYIRNSDGEYTPCKNATGVRNDMNIDLFRNKGVVYEGSTGASVCNENRLGELLSNLKGDGEKFKATIQDYAEKYGLSPRYTKPEIKKSDLFPRNNKRKLMRTLYHKEKCWFTCFPNEYNLDLYQMDKDKSFNQTLYTPCNDWMIGLGPSYGLEKIAEIMSQSDFNLHEKLKTQFENELADPHKWADVGVAEFLGRVEEAKAHNQPIREMRDAENKEREAARLERTEKEAAKYKSSISDAEKAILDKTTVKNKDINGKNLILQLFRENGIELPLKTQGWVKSSLVSIFCYPDGEWSYRFKLNGGASKVMDSYLNKLVETVETKYWQLNSEKEKTNAPKKQNGKPSIIGELAENKNTIASRQAEDSLRRDKKEQTEL